MPPLILITNDDGYQSRGLHQLVAIASELGEVVVMAPEHNSSGLSTSITCTRPMRVHSTKGPSGIEYHYCDGTPADCVKMGIEYFCPRPPDLVLSGINYGSNASINIAYSGTMGAVLEACLDGCQSIGFSLLNHSPEATQHSMSIFPASMPLKSKASVSADRLVPHGSTASKNASTPSAAPTGG